MCVGLSLPKSSEVFEALYDEAKALVHLNSQGYALMGYKKFPAQMRLTYLVCTNQVPKLNILDFRRCSHSAHAANE